MKLVKVSNLMTIFNSADYKGLDINKFIAGSQIYKKDMSECAIATTEETIPAQVDLVELTEQQYVAYREAIMAEQQAEIVTTEQKIALMQAVIDDLILNGGTL